MTISKLALQVLFRAVILFLAMLVTFSAVEIFHIQKQSITAITFLVSAFALFLIFRRTFPSVAARLGRWR